MKGFAVETTKTKGGVALRSVQNADITLTGIRVPEANRLQGIKRFRDTAQVPASTRGGVAWQALGVTVRAYELAREHATPA